MQKCRKLPRRVEAPGGEVGPAFVLEYLAVELVVPVDGERLPLRVVVGAGELDDRRLTGCPRFGDFLDQPPAATHLDQLADGWRAFGELLWQGSVHDGFILPG